MSGPTSLWHHSPLRFSPKLHQPIKSISIPAFSTSNLGFSGGFSSEKFVSRKNRIRHIMTELVRASAFSSSAGEENATMLEQEAFVSGSPEFSADIVTGGLESTLNRLSKWLVAALFGVVVLWRHDVESLWAAMGSVLNSALSILLKQILNQERPASALRSDPGMPSSHAQSIFYTVVFAIFSLVEWLGINGLTLTVSGLTLAVGSYLSWLRVSQQFHTINQVAVGSAVGSIFCILWFVLWKALVLKAFISYLWVRLLVVIGAVGFCVGFLLHVVKYWLQDER